MFQHGALFSALTVKQNVAVPLQEHTDLPARLIDELALLKIALAGLAPDAASLYPRELSGGMSKRAAVARALALDPEILFLDEPTAGLDPVSAEAFDALIVQLKSSLDLTVVLVTHDLDTLWRVTDRVAFLAAKRVAACAPIADLPATRTPRSRPISPVPAAGQPRQPDGPARKLHARRPVRAGTGLGHHRRLDLARRRG